MARKSRQDIPGSWHHIINRGLAKRALFETRADKRRFLAALAHQVRAGRIEVHAYCLMLTHFHLLVRSPIGEMSEAMRRVQNDYSRYFNRRRGRDGALIRGRFLSKPVTTDRYRRTLVRYIDGNPVKAGIVRRSHDHEHGSASHYMLGSGPVWLERSWIEARARALSGCSEYSAQAYAQVFGALDRDQMQALEQLVEARLASSADEDPLDDLVGSTPPRVRAWLQRKARLADGLRVGLPACGHQAVARALAEDLELRGAWMIEDGTRTLRGAEVARAGLLRDLCGMSWPTAARVAGITAGRLRRLGEHHHRLLVESPAYATRISAVASAAIQMGQS